MRFKEEQKERIIFYLLEKIKQGKENISRTVSEEFGINQATVHSYLNELMNSGVIGGGMLPKLNNCTSAIREGVSRVHILDGRIPHCLLLEIFTNQGIGTCFYDA